MAEALPCKLIAQVAFKAGGDVFHELWANTPHHLPSAVPSKIKACDILEGEHGTNGCLLLWNIEMDGIGSVTSKSRQQINVEKKEIVYTVIEGSDFWKLYKTVIITCQVETRGAIEFVIWTLDYELIKPDNPHPVSFLNFLIKLTEDIEAHISK